MAENKNQATWSWKKRRERGQERELGSGLQDKVGLTSSSPDMGSSSDNLGLFSWGWTTSSQKMGERKEGGGGVGGRKTNDQFPDLHN